MHTDPGDLWGWGCELLLCLFTVPRISIYCLFYRNARQLSIQQYYSCTGYQGLFGWKPGQNSCLRVAYKIYIFCLVERRSVWLVGSLCLRILIIIFKHCKTICTTNNNFYKVTSVYDSNNFQMAPPKYLVQLKLDTRNYKTMINQLQNICMFRQELVSKGRKCNTKYYSTSIM